MGWDGLDEIRVQLRGMRTRTFVDLPFRHHRPGGRPRAVLPAPGGGARTGLLVHGLPADATSPCGRCTARVASRPPWPCCGATPRRRPGALPGAPTGFWWASSAGASGWASLCAAARRPPDRTVRWSRDEGPPPAYAGLDGSLTTRSRHRAFPARRLCRRRRRLPRWPSWPTSSRPGTAAPRSSHAERRPGRPCPRSWSPSPGSPRAASPFPAPRSTAWSRERANRRRTAWSSPTRPASRRSPTSTRSS